MDQTGSIEEMPHLHRLAEASGAKAPKSEESNGHKAHYSPVDNTRREEWTNHMRFQSLVDRLLPISRCTGPVIRFTVHKATRRTHQPSFSDWKLAKSGSRYLKKTKDIKIDMKIESKVCAITVIRWSNLASRRTRPIESPSQVMCSVSGAIIQCICKKQTGISASHLGRERLGFENW